MKKIILIAIIIRILLLPITYHPDVNNHFWWGIYAQDFGFDGYYDFLNFGNYGRPEYPPLSIFLFTFVKYIFDFVFNILWQLNTTFSYFPSKLITWMDVNGYKTFLKIPSIIADIGIGLLIYKWVKEKTDQRKATLSAMLFLFNPAIIYVSALWGQIESIITLFALLALYYLSKNKLVIASIMFAISLLFKGTFVPLGLVFILYIFKNKSSVVKVAQSAVAFISLFILSAIPFAVYNPLLWIIEKYKDVFMAGAVILDGINVNAFNFWGALLGFDYISSSTPVLFLTLGQIALLIGLVLIIFISAKFIKKDYSVIIYSTLLYLTIFTFFPRVHERYLYPAIVFLTLFFVTKLNKQYAFKTLIILSFVFLINLYRLWYFPRIELLVHIADNNILARFFSLIVVGVYISLFRNDRLN